MLDKDAGSAKVVAKARKKEVAKMMDEIPARIVGVWVRVLQHGDCFIVF